MSDIEAAEEIGATTIDLCEKYTRNLAEMEKAMQERARYLEETDRYLRHLQSQNFALVERLAREIVLQKDLRRKDREVIQYLQDSISVLERTSKSLRPDIQQAIDADAAARSMLSEIDDHEKIEIAKIEGRKASGGHDDAAPEDSPKEPEDIEAALAELIHFERTGERRSHTADLPMVTPDFLSAPRPARPASGGPKSSSAIGTIFNTIRPRRAVG